MQFDIDYDKRYGVMNIGILYKFGRAEMRLALHFEKGDRDFNNLYQAMINNKRYDYDAGEELRIYLSGDGTVEFESNALTVILPIREVLQSFKEINDINIS
jgi:hypothetical protein